MNLTKSIKMRFIKKYKYPYVDYHIIQSKAQNYLEDC